MRAAVCFIITIFYCLNINLYTWYLGTMPIRYSKLWYNYTTIFAILFLFIDLQLGISGWMHAQIQNVLKTTIIINFILIILEQHLILTDANTDLKFYIFDGVVFAVSTMILISGIIHGYFKNKYEND